MLASVFAEQLHLAADLAATLLGFSYIFAFAFSVTKLLASMEAKLMVSDVLYRKMWDQFLIRTRT